MPFQTICYKCEKPISELLEDCPHCGAPARLTDEGFKYRELDRQRKLIMEGAPWGEILTKEQMSNLNGWDIMILEKTRQRMQRSSVPIDMSLVHRDVHLEMGQISDEDFQASVKKLEDMALLRRYVTLNI